MALNQIIDLNPLAALVVDSKLNLKAENMRLVDSLTADNVNTVTINNAPFTPFPAAPGALNDVLVQGASVPEWTDRLVVERIAFQASGDVAGNYLRYYGDVSVAFVIVSVDGSTERVVTVGSGLSGNINFVKVGRVVTAHFPPFSVTSFAAGAATQFLRYRYVSNLPAELIPTSIKVDSAQVQDTGTTDAAPGSLEMSSNLHTSIFKDFDFGVFTPICGLPNGAIITYLAV